MQFSQLKPIYSKKKESFLSSGRKSEQGFSIVGWSGRDRLRLSADNCTEKQTINASFGIDFLKKFYELFFFVRSILFNKMKFFVFCFLLLEKKFNKTNK